MSKRYAEPIEVEAPEGAVEAFWWRGTRYDVRQVHGRWREAGGWWESAGDKPWAAGEAREIVRLDAASRGRLAGTYEIACDLRSGRWSMCRVLD